MQHEEKWKRFYHVVGAPLLGDQNFFRAIDNKVSSLVINTLAHCGKLFVIGRQVGTRLLLGQVAYLRGGRLKKLCATRDGRKKRVKYLAFEHRRNSTES